MNWQTKLFSQLNTDELYDFLKLRIDVFVVEQTCYYPDLDDLDRDPQVRHIFCYEGKDMLAYCRVLPPKLVYDNASAIGRVIVSDKARGKKLGYQLMQLATDCVDELWPEQKCKISAQEHLKSFYQTMGFEQISDMYLEDGIPHIAMLRKPQAQ